MVAGPGEYCRLHDVQTGLVSEEPTGINVGDFLNRLAFSEGRHDHLIAAGLRQFLAHMTNVGDVLDVDYFETTVNQ